MKVFKAKRKAIHLNGKDLLDRRLFRQTNVELHSDNPNKSIFTNTAQPILFLFEAWLLVPHVNGKLAAKKNDCTCPAEEPATENPAAAGSPKLDIHSPVISDKNSF